MKLFQRYLFKALFYTTLGISAILTYIIWLAQSLRFSRYLASQELSFLGLLELCMGLLPKILLITVPVAFIVAILWCYNRIIHDNERDIMSACGTSQLFFAWPCILLSLCISGVLCAVSLYLSPLIATISKKREYSLKNFLDPSFITPGVFCQVAGRVFYVHHRQKNPNLFNGIFIYDGRDPQKKTIITGKHAYITPEKNGLKICLQYGTIQQTYVNKTPKILNFENYTTVFSSEEKPFRKKHIHELSFKELFDPLEAQRSSYEQEWQQRLIFPMLPIIDAVWSTLLLLYGRGRIWPSFYVVFATVGFRSILLGHSWTPIIFIFLIISAVILWSILLTRKRCI